jgi:hypothetical protein
MIEQQIGRINLRPWTIAAVLASAWLLVFFVLTKILSPLNPDEVLFGHIFWLSLEGKKQFIDFYSYHFPTYFLLYDLVLPHRNGDSLGFLWAVRLSNLLVLGAYVAILFAVERRSAIFLLPLLLLMLTLSRMIEVRPDTLGLLAFNGAWAVLLVGKSRRSLVLATVLAIFAAACSARGVVMGVAFGAALVWRAMIHRDWRLVLIPLAVLAFAVVAGLAAYVAEPHYVDLMLRSTLLDPAAVLLRLSMAQRVLGVDRLPQILIAATAAVLGAACVARGKERDRSGVIAIAALGQLLLIFFDPSPFPYVYGWSMVPSLAGLGLAGTVFTVDARKWIAAVGVGCAVLLALAITLYPWISGHEAAPGSNYRVLLDRPLHREAVRELPLEELIKLQLSHDRQQSLANQLLVREELCRRVRGPVLAAWQNHPICLFDAGYDWWSVKWPNFLAGQSAGPAPWFEATFRNNPPKLFIWDTGIPGVTLTLNRWAADLLRGYKLEAGFAIRLDATPAGKGSSDTAANQRNNGRS